MNKVHASMTLTMLLGAALASFMGCTSDPLPPDKNTGGSGGGTSSGAMTNCGDGKLEMGETCDDGNNAPDDGCTTCAVDACYTCTAETDKPNLCTLVTSGMSGAGCDAPKVCDGAGKCVECVDDAQCGTGFCHMNACHKCDDTVQNGDETAVDCGGAKCPKCANGKTCGTSNDNCTSGFCVDGLCCVEACDGACQSCGIPGSEGTCDVIPKYSEDPVFGAGMSCKEADGKTCNGAGACSLALGQPCQGNANCASLKCVDPAGGNNKVCLKNTGDGCTKNEDCFNNMCDTAGTMKCL